jgi:ribulose-phosphate 3-epimerase
VSEPRGRIEISPSILSADLGRLSEQVAEVAAAGADRIQVDVMDGDFVPNLTFGPATVAAVHEAAPELPIEVHLMVGRPERFLEDFASAGAAYLIIHVESTPGLFRAVGTVRQLGCRAGLALSPATPVETVRELVPEVDMVLIMTVEPGFGGQAFIKESPAKIRRVRELAPEIDIEVDGGIDARTAPLVVTSGARLLVAGTSIYRHPDGAAAGIEALRDAVRDRSTA